MLDVQRHHLYAIQHELADTLFYLVTCHEGEKMDFDLNETQKLFKSSARELFAQECPAEAVRAMIENGEPYSEALWQKLVEQGWTGLIFDEADGGMGLSYIEMAVAFEEMGRALVPGAFLAS